MLYIIQLDNKGYVAHDKHSGWFVTPEKEKACKLGPFWTNKIAKELETQNKYTAKITEFYTKNTSFDHFQPSLSVVFKEEKVKLA